MSKVNKLFRGSTLNAASLFINVIVLFFLFPFIVDNLGSRFYGLWVLVCSLTGYYFLLDFGVSTAVSRFVSRAIGKKMHEEFTSILSNSIALFFLMSIFSLMITSIIIIVVPHIVAPELKKITQLLIFLVGLEFAISLPLRVYEGAVKAHLDFDVLSVTEIFKVIVRSGLIIVFLTNGYGIIALAVINTVTNIVHHFFIFSFARLKYKIILSRSHIAWQKMKELFHFSKYVFLAQIGTLVRFKIDHFIIAGFLGLTAVTIYAVAMKIIDFFIRLMTSITGVLNPLFSQYEGKQDYDAMRKTFLIGVKFSMVISIFIGANLMIYGKFFIENWMGKSFMGAYPVLAILAFSVSIALSQSIGIGILQSMNRHKFFALINMMEALGNLALTLLLVKKFGIIGVALGTAIPMIIVKIFIQPFVVCKCIHLTPRTILAEIYYFAPVLILFYSSIYYLVHFVINIESLSYTLIGLHLLIQLPVYLLVVYFLLAEKEIQIVFTMLSQNRS